MNRNKQIISALTSYKELLDIMSPTGREVEIGRTIGYADYLNILGLTHVVKIEKDIRILFFSDSSKMETASKTIITNCKSTIVWDLNGLDTNSHFYKVSVNGMEVELLLLTLTYDDELSYDKVAHGIFRLFNKNVFVRPELRKFDLMLSSEKFNGTSSIIK